MKPTITVHTDPTIYADGPFANSVDLSGYETVRLPFWTSAERAGLKAIGVEYLYRKSLGLDDQANSVSEAILRYVCDARAVKEGK